MFVFSVYPSACTTVISNGRNFVNIQIRTFIKMCLNICVVIKTGPKKTFYMKTRIFVGKAAVIGPYNWNRHGGRRNSCYSFGESVLCVMYALRHNQQLNI